MREFWDDMSGVFATESAIDEHLQDQAIESEHFTQVRELAETGKKGLKLPAKVGTRVRFVANLQSVLTYPDMPGEGVEGTVVKVRSAQGDTTSHEDRVFVAWDDGKFRPILSEHLRRAKSNKKHAKSVRIVTSDLNALGIMFAPAMGMGITAAIGDDLVHKATKDLWSFKQDGESYVIERLFNETGEPLKV
jgi:hypothetical protein